MELYKIKIFWLVNRVKLLKPRKFKLIILNFTIRFKLKIRDSILAGSAQIFEAGIISL